MTTIPLFPFSRWFEDVARSALANLNTLRFTHEVAIKAVADGVKGDFVECGVFAGANAAMLARGSLMYCEPHRRVHLFDSFEGIPAGGPRDRGWDHPSGTSMCAAQQLAANLSRWSLPADMFVWHRGLFADTIGNPAYEPKLPREIAVLRLDADLYESTRDALPLLDRVSHNGVVIVDDFDLPGCREALIERMEAGFLTGPIYWRKQ